MNRMVRVKCNKEVYEYECQTCGEVHTLTKEEVINAIYRSGFYSMYSYRCGKEPTNNELIRDYGHDIERSCETCHEWDSRLDKIHKSIMSDKEKKTFLKLVHSNDIDGERRLKLFSMLSQLHDESDAYKKAKANKTADKLIDGLGFF